MVTWPGRSGLWIGIVSALACWTISCQPAGLPDFARPTVRTFALGGYDIRDPIPYRSITRADFRATSPPADIAEHASQMGAYTCALVMPDEDQELAVTYDAAAGAYVARVVRFQANAVMDPDCSWWNPVGKGLPPEYILEHEQIHFALVEISARNLARRLRAMEARADTADAAARDLQQKIQSAFQDSVKDIMESNTKFDNDTSGGYQPQRQSRWLAYVEGELGRAPGIPEAPVREDAPPRVEPGWEPL